MMLVEENVTVSNIIWSDHYGPIFSENALRVDSHLSGCLLTVDVSDHVEGVTVVQHVYFAAVVELSPCFEHVF